MSTRYTQHLTDDNFAIRDVVDLHRLTRIFEGFSRTTGFTVGFLDHPSQEVLIATGWLDICTKFHRARSRSMEICHKSTGSLTGKLKKPGQVVLEECENGLVDCATPVFVQGRHVATLASGQALLVPPDIVRFRRQAEMNGYDVEAYLEALGRVPVISEDRLRGAVSYLSELAAFIGELGFYNLSVRKRSLPLEREISRRKRVEEALRESQEYAKALFASSEVAMVVMDAETGVFVDCNEAAIRIYGYGGREEVIGKRPVDVSTPAQYDGSDSSTEAEKRIRICRQQGSHIFQWRHRRPDGQIWDADVHLMLFHHREKPLIQFKLQDISEQKRMEAALIQKEEKYRSLVESTSEWVWEMDGEGRFVYSNANVSDLIGYKPEEIMGRTPFETAVPEHSERSWAVFHERKPFRHLQDMHRHRDGKMVILDTSGVPIFDDQGAFSGFRGVTRDITALKEAEEALKKSEEALWSLINAPDEALLLIDEKGTILMANEILAHRLGKRVQEVLGTCQYDYFPPHVAEHRRKQYDRVMKTGKPVHFEDERKGRFFEIFGYPVFGDGGKVTKIAVFARDITARKEDEKQREGLIAELQDSMAKVKMLSGMLPICSSCKKIRNDEGYWQQVEVYIKDHSEAEFTHGLCPECAERLYPGIFKTQH